MDTKSEIMKRISSLEEDIRRAKEELKELNSLSSVQQIAVEIHGAYCRENHADGCGWEYEFSLGKHQWDGSSHKRWLEKATKLSEFLKEKNISFNEIMEITKIIT